MSATNPANTIPRWSIVGMEGMFVKMWDPPTESPATPDLCAPTNPVPEVMAAAGMTGPPIAPHTMQVDLLHGITQRTWDNLKDMVFFTVINPDVPASAAGTYPGTTIRMPNGVIFHAATSGKGPPPHTIHWHGMEPTPMNDGVGHCSMEIGKYTYQWQPTFVGTYFYHCHRNTMQHFEFGLFGLLLVEPADTYFATLANPAIPIGHCRDGKRRTGANLADFPQFPGWKGGDRTDPDPWTGDPALKFLTDPHAQTVPYDVEALWVFDDRDSVWSDLAADARTAFPRHGNHPGFDDNFARNPGVNGFLAFNDYTADYWYVTGVPVPAHKGGIGTIPAGIVIPAELNSGISGSQVSVEAFVGQTILIRCLDAAYNNCIYTFPVDLVIVEWDGRPLGVAPYGFNNAYLVPAGSPIEVSVGRRFGALIREFAPISDFAVCQFIDTRGANVPGFEQVTVTAKVPINISPLTVVATPDKASPQPAGTTIAWTATMNGGANNFSHVPRTGPFEFQFLVTDPAGATTVKQAFSEATVFNWVTAGLAQGNYTVTTQIRPLGTPLPGFSAQTVDTFTLGAGGGGQVLTVTNQTVGTNVIFAGDVANAQVPYDFQFWLKDLTGVYALTQAFSPANIWTWATAGLPAGTYSIAVQAKAQGTNPVNGFDFETVVQFAVGVAGGPVTNLTLVASPASPQSPGTPVSFTANGTGGSGPVEYQFWLKDLSGTYSLAQSYSAANVWNWATAGLAAGTYTVAAHARTVGSANGFDVETVQSFSLAAAGAAATAVNVVTQTVGTAVSFTATASGGTAPYQYQFWLKDLSGVYTLVQAFSASNVFNWSIAGLPAGTYSIAVQAKSTSSIPANGFFDVERVVTFVV